MRSAEGRHGCARARMRRRVSRVRQGREPGTWQAERHLRIGLAAVWLVLIVGTFGIALSEHLTPIDAFFDTLGLMTTSGGFEHPVTAVAKLVASLILVAGVGSL